MHDSEWSRYLAEIIYILWFQIFTTSLPMYPTYSKELVGFCKQMLAHINKKLKPMRDIEVIYRRLFEACGTCGQPEEILDLFNDMKQQNKIDPDKVTFGTYYQAYQIAKKNASNKTNQAKSSLLTGKTNPFSGEGDLLIPGVPMKESYLKKNDEDV
jgi:pentatricopeptide repeat protein